MKKKSDACTLAAALLLALASCTGRSDEHVHGTSGVESLAGYYCPMHPEVVSDKPGICPKCNMNLEPVQQDRLVQAVSPAKLVLSRQATTRIQKGASEEVKAEAFVETDMTRNLSVAARFGGRIEKLDVRYEGQYVRQGQKIMDIYSPELRTIQEEHVFLLKASPGDNVISQSRERLKLLGLTDGQVATLERSGVPDLTVAVFSPSEGYIFFGAPGQQASAASANNKAMKGAGMMSERPAVYDSRPEQIREGMYVNKDQTLFQLNDLEFVWASAFVPGQFISGINVGQRATLIPEGGMPARQGQVLLVEPVFAEPGQPFARVRIGLKNPGLKINALVHVMFRVKTSVVHQVPSSAVYHTGRNAYVWVKSGVTKGGSGIFVLKKVVAGIRSGGMTTIVSGISVNDEVALEAGLMVDSETFLSAH